MNTVTERPSEDCDNDIDPIDPFMDPRPSSDYSSISSFSWAEASNHCDDSLCHEGSEDVEFTEVLEPLSYPSITDREGSIACGHDHFPPLPSQTVEHHKQRPRSTRSRSHRRSRLSYIEENTFPVPQNFGIPDGRQDVFFNRMDINARNNFRSVIRSIILSEEHSLLERLSLLQDCESSARESNLGIPFSELVSEPLEGLDVTPLMYELIHCEPQLENIDPSITGLETVLFLVENWHENSIVHGNNGHLAWVVRKSCLRRMDLDSGNQIFQKLRPVLAGRNPNTPYLDYNLTINAIPTPGFNVFISLPDAIKHFENALRSERELFPSRFPPSLAPAWDRKRSGLTSNSKVTIEFLAMDRAWSLELGSNSVKISLVDGPSEDEFLVDASLSVVLPETDDEQPFDTTLLFRKSQLRPLCAAGVHAIGLSPAFTPCSDYNTIRGFDDPSALHDGMLLLELTVKLESIAPSQSLLSAGDKGKAPESSRWRNSEDLIDLCDSDREPTQSFSTQMVSKSLEMEDGNLADIMSGAQDAEAITRHSTTVPAADFPPHTATQGDVEDKTMQSMFEDDWDAISETETIDDDLQSGWVQPSLDSDDEQ